MLFEHDASECGASQAMNFIHRTVTILGIATVLSGMPLAVFAQSPQTLSGRMNAEEFFHQGVDKVERGNYQEAIQNFNQALQINPNLIEGYCNRGLVRIVLRDYQGAIADFNQALRLNPDHADAYNKRGNACAEMGDIQRAMTDFDQALRLKPNYAEAYYNRGLARSGLENPQGAIAHYNRAIRSNPNLAEAYGNRGLVRYRLGDQQGVMEDLQKAAQLFRDQGNITGYQQTLAVIQMIQQSPTRTPKASMPPCPEMF